MAFKTDSHKYSAVISEKNLSCFLQLQLLVELLQLISFQKTWVSVCDRNIYWSSLSQKAVTRNWWPHKHVVSELPDCFDLTLYLWYSVAKGKAEQAKTKNTFFSKQRKTVSV